MASITFKLSPADCENVIRDKPDEVYQIMFDHLFTRLTQETELHEIYRLQGEINMLMQITGLKDKARTQLNK